ncbi:hypothetical protein [Butyrivibrio sp. INlla14]|uniref:hypothetical protein n=1 Tax=Butyrivibrio sp. INlla14 TaxID=1520808 RepID=UPI0008774F91|nr:hypothetical protein [Butyrivibrio sp. INlla14]SCY62327.1 hypothetical protein SAMN02910371_03076 [Butyrivibrio sp. INlla14]
MDSQNNANKSSSTKVLLIIGIIVILALVGVIIFLLLPKEKEPEQRRSVVVNEENVEEIIEEMEKQAQEPAQDVGYYAVTQNSEWHFKDGTSESSNAYIKNLEENSADVYFDLFIAGDEENPIYQSPVIPRGGYLENFKLDKDLDPGTYDCVMIYHLVDENQNTLSTLRVTATVIVEG